MEKPIYLRPQGAVGRDTSQKMTWKALVLAYLEVTDPERRGVTLSTLYRQIEVTAKAKANPHWKDKVRQTLQVLRPRTEQIGRATWRLAETGEDRATS